MKAFIATFCCCFILSCGKAQPEGKSTVEQPDRIYFNEFPFMDVHIVADQDLIVMQWKSLNTVNIKIQLEDSNRKSVDSTIMLTGTTISFFDTKKRYAGRYDVCVQEEKKLLCKSVNLEK